MSHIRTHGVGVQGEMYRDEIPTQHWSRAKRKRKMSEPGVVRDRTANVQ